MPILHDYPEEKFGGFLAQTDYTRRGDRQGDRRAWLHDMAAGPLFLQNHQPPIAGAGASPPTWMLSEAQCRAAAKRFDKGQPNDDCKNIEWNWLGTDDQGRDVLDCCYGFRLSLLFGLTLAGISSVVGIAAGAVQGYFGGWTNLVQRFIKIWSSLPASLSLDHYFLDHHAELLRAARHSAFVFLGVARSCRASGIFAPRNFEYVNAARALGLSNGAIIVKHVLPNAMVATLTFLPFVLNSSITTLTALDFLGFGLPPGSPSAWANSCCRESRTWRRHGSASPAFWSSRSCSRCWSSSAKPCATPSPGRRFSGASSVPCRYPRFALQDCFRGRRSST